MKQATALAATLVAILFAAPAILPGAAGAADSPGDGSATPQTSLPQIEGEVSRAGHLNGPVHDLANTTVRAG